MTEPASLSGVPETMLQTVYARAKESRGRGAIHDATAEQLIEKLHYDFFLADKDTAMHSGVIARSIVLDRLTAAWLDRHPGAIVLNIACGLDTRCDRMQGYAHWYNLDLPEVIAVREKLLPEAGTVSQIAISAMDDWGGAIAETDAPVLVIIEGLTMYLLEPEVKRIFEVIAGRFDRATVFVETMNPVMAKHFKEKIHRGQPRQILLGHQKRKGLGPNPAGFPVCGGTQPDGGHGRLYPALPRSRQNSGSPGDFQ